LIELAANEIIELIVIVVILREVLIVLVVLRIFEEVAGQNFILRCIVVRLELIVFRIILIIVSVGHHFCRLFFKLSKQLQLEVLLILINVPVKVPELVDCLIRVKQCVGLWQLMLLRAIVFTRQ